MRGRDIYYEGRRHYSRYTYLRQRLSHNVQLSSQRAIQQQDQRVEACAARARFTWRTLTFQN